MDAIRNGWFSEKSDLWEGQCLSLQVDEVLLQKKSQFQDILVLQTKSHGRALVLDGIIQCTQHDEFAYQEMITFLPLNAHSSPKKVLIVGGGDGGVAREVEKHPQVLAVTQVEIDGDVIDASKKYLPFMSTGFSSKKLDLKVADGFEFLRTTEEKFDVIITDSSDPIGPAVNLFTEWYFKLLKGALKPDGVVCSQAGTVWNNLPHVRETLQHCRKHFTVARYAVASVPTYPTGQIGFIIATCDVTNDVTKPKAHEQLKDLRYYNEEVHQSAFVLPNFARDALS